MIWLAWRQFRTQALATLGLFAALAVLVLVTGLHLRHVYDSLGGAHCAARRDCTALSGHDTALADVLGPALLAIPALLGMFWGAPLVARECESGTYRLAWTQSVTRRRWLSVRVVLVAGAAIIVAGLASWLISWWFAPLDAVHMNRLAPSVFTARGIVAIGYAGFAFALGIATSTLTRRTLPAMAATLLTFIAARSVITLWVRPHLLHAKEVLVSVTYGQGVGFVSSASGVSVAPNVTPIPNAWILSTALVDRARLALSAAQLHDLLIRACPAIVAGLPQRAGSPRRARAGQRAAPSSPASKGSRTRSNSSSPTSHQATTGRCKRSRPRSSSPPRSLSSPSRSGASARASHASPPPAGRAMTRSPARDADHANDRRTPRPPRRRPPLARALPCSRHRCEVATASHLTGPRVRDGDFVCSVWH